MKQKESHVGAEKAVDVFNPETQKRLLFSQDKKLLEAVSYFATKICSMPHDPKFSDIDPQALLVGGFVRDAMWGLHPKDADVEVYGVSPERLHEMLEGLFPGQVKAVGKAFGVLKVSVEEGIEFDVSIPRRESKSGQGHKGFEISSDPSMSIDDAARRRDFSFNSLAADILAGEVYDHFGGLEDLKNRTLRATDPERFIDDPLRVYRAVQFAARYGLTVESKTFELMSEMIEKGELEHLPNERITEEWEKMLLKSPNPSVGLELMRELGIIERYYPELHALIDTPQEPEWHPEGNVWIHTNMVLDCAATIANDPTRGFTKEQKLEVLLGAVCHDLGKPATTEVKDGRIKSHAHDSAGEVPTRSFFSRHSFGQHALEASVKGAIEHLQPAMLYRSLEKGTIDERLYRNAIRRLAKRIHPVSPRVLIAISEADSRGRAFPDALTREYTAGKKFMEIVTGDKLEETATVPLIQGRDVLAHAKTLGKPLKPGPVIGTILRSVEAARDEGVIETRDQAIALLDTLIEQHV